MAAVHYPRTLRFRIIARTPTVFIDYLFEILIAVASVLVGVGYLTGFTSANSLIQLLPDLVAVLYAWVLILGSVTVFIGLVLAKYGTIVATGLRLLSFSAVTYAVSIIWYLGLRSALSVIVIYAALAVLSAWRSFILRSTYLLFASGGTENKIPPEAG